MRLHIIGVLVCCLLSPAAGQTQQPSGVAKKANKTPRWTLLFDGKSLAGWQIIEGKNDKEIEYEGHGKVEVRDGCLVIGTGQPATGVRAKHKLPRSNYEVALEAKRVKGTDFFCGMSFPVGDGALTLILGGWGGWVVGLSNIDGERAIDNETCQSVEFKNGRWYAVRVRVTDAKVEVWLDKEKIIDLERADHKFEVTWEMAPCLPFGFATWDTTGALRRIRYRPLKSQAKIDTRDK